MATERTAQGRGAPGTGPGPARISPLVHAFVALSFVGLGVAFITSTALLWLEFGDTDYWWAMLAAHSHLFVFFPVFGIAALVAFYWPSVVFTHLYWTGVRWGANGSLWWGRLRYMVGALVVGVASYFISLAYESSPTRAIWEISRQALEHGAQSTSIAPDMCVDVVKHESLRRFATASSQARPIALELSPCQRQPVLTAFLDLRHRAMRRWTISEFARACRVDELRELPATSLEPRYCAPAGALLSANDCCAFQQRFERDVRDAARASPSLAARYDSLLFKAKVFFVVVIGAIGFMLGIWRNALMQRYEAYLSDIDRGIIVGAAAMLLWPVMDYAYLQTTNVLFGRDVEGFQVRASLVLVIWAVPMLYYFLTRRGRVNEALASVGTILGSVFTLLRHQEINDFAVRAVGVGAAEVQLWICLGIALCGIVFVLWSSCRSAGRRRDPMAKSGSWPGAA